MEIEKMTLPTDESIHKKFHEIKNKWHDADGTNMDRVSGALNDFSSWIRSQTMHNDDAIEFAEWIDGCMYSRMSDKEKYLGWADGNETIAKTTEELYKIFKEYKSKK